MKTAARRCLPQFSVYVINMEDKWQLSYNFLTLWKALINHKLETTGRTELESTPESCSDKLTFPHNLLKMLLVVKDGVISSAGNDML